MTARELLDAWKRRTLAILDPKIRQPYLCHELSQLPLPLAAEVMDLLVVQADQAETGAREALASLVVALSQETSSGLVQRLREEAAGRALPALAGLLHRPPFDGERVEDEDEGRVPEIGGKRLSLGERKALARRPNRAHFDKLLLDPHPAVITNLLGNPRLVEDDVVRLAAKRPGRADVLSAIARHPTWTQRPRVRVALVLNPATPLEIAIPLVSVLSQSDLVLVSEVTTLRDEVREAAREHLGRRRSPAT